MHGDNTKMPLQWENRSPSDVALQILKKHGLEKNWMKNKKNAKHLYILNTRAQQPINVQFHLVPFLRLQVFQMKHIHQKQ